MYLLSAFLLCVLFTTTYGDVSSPVPRETKHHALIQLHSQASVNICQCCYDLDSKANARARNITIRPEGSDWLKHEQGRISIDLENCTAVNKFPGVPAPFDRVESEQLIDTTGSVAVPTATGRAVQLQLTRAIGSDGVPYLTGSIQAFTVGHAHVNYQLLHRVNTYLCCDIAYCDLRNGANSVSGSRPCRIGSSFP
jgi:hypothetical protein